MNLAANCTPRMIAVDSSEGCTLTRASVIGMTPDTFEAQGMKEVGMDRIIANATQAKAAGYKENTLEMLLMGRLAPVKNAIQKASIGGNQSVILPYIYRRQKRNINSNYWLVSAGAATTGAGTNGIPASAWDLTVQNTASTYASSLTNLEKYFLPGKYVLVETVNSSTKASYSLQYKIIASVNADAGGVSKAKLTLEPNVSATAWAGYSPTQKAVYQPIAGTMIGLSNSVSDYESWCHNEVSENSNKLLHFWLQTSRFTHSYNEEYLKALNAALTSGYFKTFASLPLAEQKRIQYAKYQRDWLNSCFYGQRINEYQSPETYTSLPQVVDPANPDCVFEYKANALGFKQQLIDCSRVYDHQGNALNLDTLASTLYSLKRAREADGGTVDTIDIMTDRWTAGHILEIMTSFFKTKYGVTYNMDFAKEQTLSFGTFKAFNYRVYPLPEDLGGFNLAVFYHPYFDDKVLAAASGDQRSRARTIFALDWTDIQIGIAGTASAQRKTNEADALYQCVIKPNIHHYMLESTTWTSIIEDPMRHYIVDNFSDACPTLTVAGCTVS